MREFWIIMFQSGLLIGMILLIRIVFQKRLSSRVKYMLWIIPALRLLFPFITLQPNDTQLAGFMEKPYQAAAAAVEATGEGIVSVRDKLQGGKVVMVPAIIYNETLSLPEEIFVPEEEGMAGAVSAGAIGNVNDTDAGQVNAGGVSSLMKLDAANQIMLLIWLVGILAGFGAAIVQNARFMWYMRKNGTLLEDTELLQEVFGEGGRPLSVLYVPKAPSPCLAGVIRPCIIVNEKAVQDREILLHVLHHEYVHYCGRDYLFTGIRNLLCIIYWFHPMVWLGAAYAAQDAEEACDERVMKDMDSIQKQAYGRTLLHLLTSKTGAEQGKRASFMCNATTMIGGKKALKKRIRNIVKTPKTNKWALAAAALLIGAAAVSCGTQVKEEPQNQISDIVYTAEITPFEKGVNILDICTEGDVLYYSVSCFTDAEEGQAGGLYVMEAGQTEAVRLPVELEEGEYILMVNIGPEGNLYLLINREGDSGRQIFLRITDKGGKEISQTDITSVFRGDGQYGTSINGMEIDDDGYIYFTVYLDQIYVLDTDHRFVFQKDAEDAVLALVKGRDGKIYTVESGGKLFIKEIDKKNNGYGKIYDDLPFTGNDLIISTGIQYDLLVSNGNYIMDYALAEGNSMKLFSWVDYEIIGRDVAYMEALSDGRLYAVSKRFSSSDTENKLIYLREAAEEDAQAVQDAQVPEGEKTVITYGCMKLGPYDATRNNYIQRQIIEFNRNNPDYILELKEYGEDEWDFQGALTRISAEIASGGGPDIIDLYLTSMLALAEQGYLEDIGACLDSDEELKREDYYENVLKACEIDGTLYMMPFTFSLDTIIGKTSVIGDREGWTLDEMLEWIDGYPEGTFIFAEVDTFMAVGLWCSWDKFIDWENAVCSFNSDDFVRLVEMSVQFSDKDYNWETGYNTQGEDMKSGKYLLKRSFLSDFSLCRFEYNLFGESISVIGYPSESGRGTLLGTDVLFGINVNSSYKEAAWEFIRSFLTKEYQIEYVQTSISSTFPILKEAFDYSAESTMKIMSFGGGGPFTREEADAVKDYIENASFYVLGAKEQTVYGIILEEVSAYWDGSKTVKEVADIIQNRVHTYLEERK